MKVGIRATMVVLAVFGLLVAVVRAEYGDSEDCADVGHNCAQLSKYCNQLDTLLYCQATCGVCGTPKPIPTEKPISEVPRVVSRPAVEECVDIERSTRCAYLAREGMCAEHGEKCAFTCGLCIASPTPMPHIDNECFDVLPRSTCTYRAGLGQCNAVAESCAATCGFCTPGAGRSIECAAKKTTVCIMADTNLMGADQWDVVSRFVGRVVDGIYGSFPQHDEIRFAGVIFGETVHRAKGPSRFGERVIQLHENFAYMKPTSSRIDLGMEMCQKVFARKPRDDEDHVALLISGGDLTLEDGEEIPADTLHRKADELKEAGVKIYSVAVQEPHSIARDLLRGLSGFKDSSAELYTTVASVNDFRSFAGELVMEECPGDN